MIFKEQIIKSSLEFVHLCISGLLWLFISISNNLFLFQISHWVEDDTTFCLMNLIILFCTDQTSQLEARGRCESLQTHFSNLLFRYFQSRSSRSEARSMFSEGIRLVSCCRELNKLAAKAKLCCKDHQEDETNWKIQLNPL